MGAPLTPAQRRVLDFLREFVLRHRFAPSAREIAGHFGIAEKNAFYYLELLERKGYIRRLPHHPRRIEFVADGEAPRFPLRIPVLGRVPGGPPREAIETAGEEILLDPSLAGLPAPPSGAGPDGTRLFSLRVRGDSMEGAHICDGDYVIIRVQETADDGDIVVAVVDGEATVKRLRRDGETVRLEAANPAYPPFSVPPDVPSFRIAGKVIGVFRRIPAARPSVGERPGT